MILLSIGLLLLPCVLNAPLAIGGYPPEDSDEVKELKRGYFEYYQCILECYKRVYKLKSITSNLCESKVNLDIFDKSDQPFERITKSLECITIKCGAVIPDSVCNDKGHENDDVEWSDHPDSSFSTKLTESSSIAPLLSPIPPSRKRNKRDLSRRELENHDGVKKLAKDNGDSFDEDDKDSSDSIASPTDTSSSVSDRAAPSYRKGYQKNLSKRKSKNNDGAKKLNDDDGESSDEDESDSSDNIASGGSGSRNPQSTRNTSNVKDGKIKPDKSSINPIHGGQEAEKQLVFSMFFQKDRDTEWEQFAIPTESAATDSTQSSTGVPNSSSLNNASTSDSTNKATADDDLSNADSSPPNGSDSASNDTPESSSSTTGRDTISESASEPDEARSVSTSNSSSLLPSNSASDPNKTTTIPSTWGHKIPKNEKEKDDKDTKKDKKSNIRPLKHRDISESPNKDGTYNDDISAGNGLHRSHRKIYEGRPSQTGSNDYENQESNSYPYTGKNNRENVGNPSNSRHNSVKKSLPDGQLYQRQNEYNEKYKEPSSFRRSQNARNSINGNRESYPNLYHRRTDADGRRRYFTSKRRQHRPHSYNRYPPSHTRTNPNRYSNYHPENEESIEESNTYKNLASGGGIDTEQTYSNSYAQSVADSRTRSDETRPSYNDRPIPRERHQESDSQNNASDFGNEQEFNTDNDRKRNRIYRTQASNQPETANAETYSFASSGTSSKQTDSNVNEHNGRQRSRIYREQIYNQPESSKAEVQSFALSRISSEQSYSDVNTYSPQSRRLYRTQISNQPKSPKSETHSFASRRTSSKKTYTDRNTHKGSQRSKLHRIQNSNQRERAKADAYSFASSGKSSEQTNSNANKQPSKVWWSKYNGKQEFRDGRKLNRNVHH